MNNEFNMWLSLWTGRISPYQMEIRPLKKGVGSPVYTFYGSKDINDITRVAEENKGNNIFYGILGRAGNVGGKESIKEAHCLWADIDFKDLQDGQNEADGLIATFDHRPSLQVFTGGGYHVYWFLDKNTNDLPRVERILKGLVPRLRSDVKVAQVACILRPPGTINWKYNPPRDVRVVSFSPESTYTLDDFKEWEIKQDPKKIIILDDTTEQKLNIQQYLKYYKVPVIKVKKHEASTLYCLKSCLFEDSHTVNQGADNEAAIGQQDTGMLFYQCFHNSCKDKTWADAKEKISGTAPLTNFVARDIKPLIKQYVERATGQFTMGSIASWFEIKTLKERNELQDYLEELEDMRIITRIGNKHGTYRPVERNPRIMVLGGIKGEPSKITLPLDLHTIVNLFPKNVILVAGEKDSGKGHPNGTKILTPVGWKNIEELIIGDNVFSQDGTITEITGVYPRGPQQCFEFCFNDRTKITTDFEHLWTVMSPYNQYSTVTGHGKIRSNGYREYQTMETYKILARTGIGKVSIGTSFRIPKAEPLQYQEQEVSIDPYLMGLLLGDGSFRKGTPEISTGDQEIIDYCLNHADVGVVRKYKRENCHGVSLLKMVPILRGLNLWGCNSSTKFIPKQYLFNSIEIRKNLLKGLLDTDGTISKTGQTIVFTTVSPQLSEDVAFLVRSLSCRATITSRHTNYTHNGEHKRGRLSYNVHMKIKDFCPFALPRKIARYRITEKTDFKKLSEIKNAGIQNTTCISIAHPSGLYVAQDFIVTHNTSFALNTAFSNRDIMPVRYINSEMGEQELDNRIILFPDHKLSEWKKITWIEQSSKYEDAIDPYGLNIIDFLEIGKDAFEAVDDIKRVFDKLQKGLLLIVMQKRSYKEFAVGGEGTLEKARLAINLEHRMGIGNVCKITVAKNWTGKIQQPKGYECGYKIISGGKMQIDRLGWYKPEEAEVKKGPLKRKNLLAGISSITDDVIVEGD